MSGLRNGRRRKMRRRIKRRRRRRRSRMRRRRRMRMRRSRRLHFLILLSPIFLPAVAVRGSGTF